jgi:hypothetical protein
MSQPTPASATAFWTEFLTEALDKAQERASRIARALGFLVEFRMGLNCWYAQSMPERNGTIEMVISANWNEDLVGQVDMLYAASLEQGDAWPAHLHVSKYCITSRATLNQMRIMQGDSTVCMAEDIKFMIAESKTHHNKWDLFLHVPADIRSIFLEVDTVPDESCQVTANALFMELLHNLVGEYHILHTIGEKCFVTTAADMYDARDALAQLDAAIQLDPRNNCSRCGAKPYNVRLFRCSRCKDAHYCSRVCQRADWSAHKKICATKAVVIDQ